MPQVRRAYGHEPTVGRYLCGGREGLKAAERYSSFVKSHRAGRMIFGELGVRFNTPGIIKYPLWQMTTENPQAVYACVNTGQAVCQEEIAERSICLDGDIGGTVKELLGV